MSALRVRTPAGVALVDPCTQLPIPHAKPTLRRQPADRRAYLAHLTDAEVLSALHGRTQAGAAIVLGTSQASIARRLRQMRAGELS